MCVFIREFTLEHGYAPTLREIAAAMGVASTKAVEDALVARRRNGLLSWDRGRKSRTIRVHAIGIVT